MFEVRRRGGYIMKRSKYFLMIALACASLGMTACGGKNTDRASGEVTGTETEAGKTDTSDAVVEVNFGSLFTGDDGVTMDKIVNQFNEEHPNIKVNHIAMEATTDLYVKLPMVANDDKQAPDLLSLIHI